MGKRGIIVCPSCGTENGARSFFCKNSECGHRFKDGEPKTVKPPNEGGQRGKKLCPGCNTLIGVRSFACSCGYKFRDEEPKTAKSKGVQRGYKLCPDCNLTLAAKSSSCECGHVFYERKTDVKVQSIKKSICADIDWKNLKVGNRIEVLTGSGDHYISNSGETIYMQDPGVYIVNGTDDNGIIVQGKSGLGYIYMGERKTSELTPSLVKESHQIILV